MSVHDLKAHLSSTIMLYHCIVLSRFIMYLLCLHFLMYVVGHDIVETWFILSFALVNEVCFFLQCIMLCC